MYFNLFFFPFFLHQRAQLCYLYQQKGSDKMIFSNETRKAMLEYRIRLMIA